MKIETQPIDEHQVKLTVEADAASLEEAKQRAARQLSRRVKLPGFRPGKAPYAVILRQIGEAAILEEAIEFLIEDIYPKMIQEAGIKPYGPGKLEKVNSVEPPVFEFVVPLAPEVTLGDYRSLSRPYEPKVVTDAEIDEVLNKLREQHAVLEPADRPAQEGDMVNIHISAERKDPDEGESVVLVRERSIPVVISAAGKESKEEWPFPGFSQELIGLSVDEEKTINHTFAEDSDFESLRGETAEFHARVESVKNRSLPELNDDFASEVGTEYASLEALRAEVRKNLESQAEQAYNEEYDEAVLDELIGQSTIKYPAEMLNREVEDVIHRLEHRLGENGMDIELYLKTRQMDMDGLRADVKPVAESRLKKSLVLIELAKVEGVDINPEELEDQTRRTLRYFEQTLPRKDQRKLKNTSVIGNVMENIMADMLMARSMERLRDYARGRAQPATETQPEAMETPAEAASTAQAEVSAESIES